MSAPWDQEELAGILLRALQREQNKPISDVRHAIYLEYRRPCHYLRIGQLVDAYTPLELFDLVNSEDPRSLYQETGLRMSQSDRVLLKTSLEMHLQECEHCRGTMLDSLMRSGVNVVTLLTVSAASLPNGQPETGTAVVDWTRRYENY